MKWLSSRWRARSPRERALAALAAAALVAGTLELAWLGPQRTARAQLLRETDAARTHLGRLELTAQALAARYAPRAPDPALAARRAQAQAAIERTQVDLTAPQDMANQLAAILARHAQLRVIGMQSLQPKPVVAGAEGKSLSLYEHGLRVDVEGRYLDLLAWLQALERAPHRVYWRSLEIKADGTVPVTRIEMFTLSKEPVWLRL